MRGMTSQDPVSLQRRAPYRVETRPRNYRAPDAASAPRGCRGDDIRDLGGVRLAQAIHAGSPCLPDQALRRIAGFSDRTSAPDWRSRRSVVRRPRSRTSPNATSLGDVPAGVLHIAKRNGAAERMAVSARCRMADHPAIGEDRFVMIEHRFGSVSTKLDQPALRNPPSRWRSSASRPMKSRPFEFHCEHQAGIERRILIADIMAPVAIGLFDAAAIERMQAREFEAERLRPPRESRRTHRARIRSPT